MDSEKLVRVNSLNFENGVTPSSSHSSENVFRAACHQCPRSELKKSKDKCRLISVSVICMIFIVAEVTGGILSNSLALISEAAHLLTDFGAFMVSLLSLWVASKPRTQSMNFGFYRAEILGALISVLSIWLITGILVYEAVKRVVSLNFNIDPFMMVFVSVGGMLANIIMCFILLPERMLKCSLVNSKKSEESILMKSAFIHVLGDLVQSAGVFVASLIIYFQPKYKIVDPICTFIFSVIVLVITFRIMKDILRVLMEAVPKHVNFMAVKEVLYSIPGVAKVHNLRMWSLSMEKVALSAHIVVRKGEDPIAVLEKARKDISENFDIFEVTLQIEEMGLPLDMCTICT